MRMVKTADGNIYYIKNGRVSDAHKAIKNARLARPLNVKIGEPLRILYYAMDSNGNTIIDHTGKPEIMSLDTAPVVL